MAKPHTKMIVCINTQDRILPSIGYLNYDCDDDPADIERLAALMKNDFDEIYIVNLQPANREFIKEIRKHGKRIWR